MHALLISTYELGRQPFGLASPAAWLRAAGWDVVCVDISRDRLRRDAIERADVIGFHLPMHTATRLAGPVISASQGDQPVGARRAPTASTRRSTPSGSGRSASTRSSAASSRKS